MTNRADTIADDENVLFDREHQMSLQVHREGLKTLILNSVNSEVHWKIRKLFGSDAMYLVTHGQKTAFTATEEQLFDKIIASLSSEDIQKLRLGYPKKLTCKDAKFKTKSETLIATVTFRPEVFMKYAQKGIRHIIRDSVRGRKPLIQALRDIGISLEPHPIVSEDALIDGLTKAIDQRLGQSEEFHRSLRGSLAGETNELNVQMALGFAQHLSEKELHEALNPDEEHADVHELRGKVAIHHAISELAALHGISEEESYSDITGELTKVRRDLDALSAPGVATGQCKAIAGITIPADIDRNQYRRDQLRTRVEQEQDRLQKLSKQYDKIAKKLESIASFAKQAVLPDSKALGEYVDLSHDPPRLRGKDVLEKDCSPDQIAQALKQELDIKESGYDEELRKAQAKEHHPSGQLTGAAAILAIYKAYMKKQARLGKLDEPSEMEMQNVANMILTRNTIDNDMVVDVRETIKDILEGDYRMKEMGVMGKLKTFVVNRLLGSEKTYIQNLERACGIRGRWHNAEYSKLVTYYFALREAFNPDNPEGGQLRHGGKYSTFAERQLRMLGEVIAKKEFLKSSMHAFNEQPAPARGEGHEREAKAHHEGEEAPPVADHLLNTKTHATAFLAKKLTDLPQAIQDRVKQAMTEAAENTGWKRRLLGRGAAVTAGAALKYGVAAPVKKGWEYGVVAPATLGKDIVMTPVNVGMGAVSGISSGVRSGVGNLFQYLFVDKKKFYGSAQASSH